MKKKWINCLLFALTPFYCLAQTAGFTFSTRLDSVKTSGFYNIEVTPELGAHIKTDYSDIRITNAQGKWIPHRLYIPAYEQTSHTAIMDLHFSLTENSKANTTLIIEQGASATIMSNIVLTLSNTAAARTCVLSGSDDKQNWFIINDSIGIAPVADARGSVNQFFLYFPPSSYKYFRLVIHNNNKDPFDIKDVGYSAVIGEAPNSPAREIINPMPAIQQKDSGRISYVRVTQQQPYQFERIRLQLTGVPYFTRRVELYISGNEKHSFASPGILSHSFTVSNNSSPEFNVPLSKANTFYLLIYNEDNLPLTVKGISSSLYSRYLVTYLEKDSSYSLVMDNAAAVQPDYDLPQFKNRSDSFAYIHFANIEVIPANKQPAAAVQNNNWILWSSIAAALLILLFFTWKMLKEVDKRKTT